ncbi:B12-binding domain-containing radical SAM protein [Candidatus Aminicenantes bacterium AC-708-M15]|jgi:radical SAM superfamily enzyme YgiQ (UPF0313 family)|nr:B12-binding domain-containing radical SAM protein [SCandidatus Aminicenantes bacterium Aminicenantia_JdfR_composite]MCP2597629.1 B12-binding domain-containing radical SAM protein [Candidatus Aminicenantes bacterium AC-335-G13]MCP2598203.1 B12-binding domain-containing radical SAM protein [Candidatus Aminicenantes bacterium AC-335-L06]MCP2603964.1 B12-binding domain-containing radical SAM protein [Candidatus Aminicenantes bacterium AC-708-M15]MCP2605580.1 B12-binding domain-containing radical
MRVQLFVPPGGYLAERWAKEGTLPPLGLLYIGAILEKNGINVKIVPSDVLNLGWNDIKKEILDYKPDIIGVTSTTENRFQSFKVVKIAKRTFPKALTVLGGPHASMAAEDTLSHLPELDVVVRGEGELTMLELCEKWNGRRDEAILSSIQGISYRIDNRIFSNPSRPPIHDLDSLPFPARHLVPDEKYKLYVNIPGKGKYKVANIMTSRGCPFNCNFCATPINWGRRVRMRSPENVVAEIEYVIEKYGAKFIWFFDDTFNANPKRVSDICDLIIKKNLDISWSCEVRVDLLDKALLSKMKKAGLHYLFFGIEAGSERVRREIIHKNIDIQDVENVVEWCNELNIIPTIFFIFSHPTETWEEAKETIYLMEKFKTKADLSSAILHIYPGTPLEKYARENKILPDNFTWARKRHPKIITLPFAQGDVPLFKDKLTWAQISELIFRWMKAKGKTSVFKKIPQVLTNIRSFSDIKRYLIMAFVYLKVKFT